VRGLVELFEMEKALYELRYEAGNRPGWINVPLQGILAMCGLSPNDGAENAMHSKGD
jgi:maltose alpha-D-glucosyltransferase / alpha-amylase